MPWHSLYAKRANCAILESSGAVVCRFYGHVRFGEFSPGSPGTRNHTTHDSHPAALRPVPKRTCAGRRSKLRLDKVVSAQLRTTRGKNEARRVRVTGMIPGIIYGAFKDSVAVTLNPKDVLRILRSKTGHNSIFDVEVEGVERTPVIVSDESYDPIKGNLLHVDFRRIDLTRKLKVAIPVHVSGESKGVKQQGGSLDVITRQVEIECIPDDIPNDYAVDVTDLMVNGTIRVSDLPLKPGVKILTPGESMIAHVIAPKEEAVVVEEAAPTKKGKKDAAKAPAKAAAAPAKKK